MDREEPGGLQFLGTQSLTRLSDEQQLRDEEVKETAGSAMGGGDSK